jgi:hypothetical protein
MKLTGGGGTEVLREKLVLVSHCTSQIPHGLTQDRTTILLKSRVFYDIMVC